MPKDSNQPFAKKSILIVLTLVVIVVLAILLYRHDHRTVAVTGLPAGVTSGTASSPIEPLTADKLVQTFYDTFITSNQPTSVIQKYGTANLLTAYTKYYVHNSSSVSSQNYADGSIVCGSVKPKSIASVGTLTAGATSAQVQVVEVENKSAPAANQTATLAARVIHQGSNLKIDSIQCQSLVGSDSHSAP